MEKFADVVLTSDNFKVAPPEINHNLPWPCTAKAAINMITCGLLPRASSKVLSTS